MRKPTKAQIERARQIEEARDAGRGWFVNHSDVPAAAACREASRIYDADGLGKAFVLAFFEGFQQARLRRDEYLTERGEP